MPSSLQKSECGTVSPTGRQEDWMVEKLSCTFMGGACKGLRAIALAYDLVCLPVSLLRFHSCSHRSLRHLWCHPGCCRGSITVSVSLTAPSAASAATGSSRQVTCAMSQACSSSTGGTTASSVSAPQADADAFFFSVTDTGMGIPPDALSRLFQPFVQVGPLVSRQMLTFVF